MGFLGNSILIISVLVALYAVVFNFLDVADSVAFIMVTYTKWKHNNSPWYMDLLKQSWDRKFPNAIPAMPVLELFAHNLTKEEFLEKSQNFAVPVVIRGAASFASNHWSADYLFSHYANESVAVIEFADKAKGLIRMQSRTFDDFQKMHKKGREVAIVGSSSIFYRRKDLIDEISTVIDPYLETKSGEKLYANQFFMTAATSVTEFHIEVGNNVYRQFVGKKKWTVISPEYNSYLCMFPLISGTSCNSCTRFFSPEERKKLFGRFPRYEATLEPGDIFVNAPWWWHEVESIDDGVNPFQVSIAGRIINHRQNFITAPLPTVIGRKYIVYSL